MNAKQAETFKEMTFLFEVENESGTLDQKMAIEESYRSFKIEMKELQLEWRQLVQ